MKNILADTSLNLIDCLQEILNTGYIPKSDPNYIWVENEIRFAKEQIWLEKAEAHHDNDAEIYIAQHYMK
jgi:hypothetical protein